jgi:hypothetical protein
MSEMMATMPNLKTQPQYVEVYDSGHDLLNDRQSRERHNKFIQGLVASWPIGVGMLLALCAPMLSDVLAIFKPWGMWIVFPFAELCRRPELHMGSEFQQMAPQVMLFLQFPLEGLMAKKFLRGRVTIGGVAGQVFIYHLLGVAQLWLVWRALGTGIAR